jgi:type III pantothenate kinase
MNIVVDIGNTHTKLAWFDQGEIIECTRLVRTELANINKFIRKRHAEKAIVSSVGATNASFTRLFGEDLKKLIFLDHKTPLPFQIVYKTPETLGHDRIAACAGAYYIYPKSNVLIMDMGTAITIDFVNAKGEYLGGNISPGLQTRFRALNEYTAKLPLVDADITFPRFGTDTRTAIVAGVQQGIIFELDSYMDDFATRYPDCKFIITGGDANFFVSAFKKTIFAIPELVLTGLNFILEFNASGGKP